MRLPCFDCALRKSGAFKPVNDVELAFINEMKRDHLAYTPGAEIIAAGQEQAEIASIGVGGAGRQSAFVAQVLDELVAELVHRARSARVGARIRRSGAAPRA